MSVHRAFVLRRLHSLSGVVPLSAFFAEHMWTNAASLAGDRAFDKAVANLQRIPGLWFLEVFGILLPLLFHASYGIWVAVNARPDLRHYAYPRHWAYMLQRVTGVLTLMFVLWHLWELRVQKAFFGMRPEYFSTELADRLGALQWGIPWMSVLYVVGVLAAAYHFANGLWGFLCSWGVVATRPAQQRALAVCAVLGVSFGGLGVLSVLHFATGWTLSGFDPYF